ncbi:MAG TPA: 16S rRNA (cytosine(967)-C(5))-methyltransferase RsmB [Bacillota bacterium]|nr:16S rRNA (cytosine(967)-C(5))-methyltransferase RsmB [Bacillota bacterium]HPE38741.1 16S rRNA (cytosine(967)-C(5))-methyltransferase RsmB [Bacillota bacterium]
MREKKDDARKLAYDMLLEVLEHGGYSNLVMKQKMKDVELDARDRALATAVFYGTITRIYLLDYVLAPILSKPIAKLDGEIRTILRMGAWQILFSTSIPSYAAVTSSVSLAKSISNRGGDATVNAVLRKLAAQYPNGIDDDCKFTMDIACSVKKEIAGIFVKGYGKSKAASILQALLEAPTICVRKNPLSLDEKTFIDALASENIIAKPTGILPYAYWIDLPGGGIEMTRAYKEGLFMVQSISAMFVSHLASPAAHDRVLDVCGAPGGKTCHMAALMQDQGTIDCIDISEIRLRLVEEHAARLGFHSISTRACDATTIETNSSIEEKSYDVVITDVPCSGLGLLHKKPDIRLTMDYDTIMTLLPIQAQILEAASSKVKEGGVLMYSTCTVNPSENEKQIAAFLEKHTDFERVALTSLLPDFLLDIPRIRESATNGEMTLLPDEFPCDGFYMAKLRRKTNG